jgi:hypothetical protein
LPDLPVAHDRHRRGRVLDEGEGGRADREKGDLGGGGGDFVEFVVPIREILVANHDEEPLVLHSARAIGLSEMDHLAECFGGLGFARFHFLPLANGGGNIMGMIGRGNSVEVITEPDVGIIGNGDGCARLFDCQFGGCAG